MSKLQTIYLTDQVLTNGIREIEAEVKPTWSGDPNEKDTFALVYIEPKSRFGGKERVQYLGNDFHLTREEAIKDAHRRVKEKVAKLQKKIVKFESMTFE